MQIYRQRNPFIFILQPIILSFFLVCFGCENYMHERHNERYASKCTLADGTMKIHQWETDEDNKIKFISLFNPCTDKGCPKDWLFKTDDNPEYSKLDYDDKISNGWEYITVPMNWMDRTKKSPTGEEISNYYNGMAWYRLHIQFPDTPHDRTLLGVELGWIDDVDETYFNGHLIGKTGHFPDEDPINFLAKHAYDKTRIYPIPNNIVNWGKADNILAVRVHNVFIDDQGGLYMGNPRLGAMDRLMSVYYNLGYILIILAAIYLFTGLYHAFLFYKRPHTYENLLFFIFCLMIAVFSLLKSQIKYEIISDFQIMKFTEYILEVMMVMVFAHFVLFYFEQKAFNIPVIIIDILTIVSGLLLAIFYYDVNFYLRMTEYYRQWVWLGCMLYIVFYLAKQWRSGFNDAKLMLFGFILFSITVAADILISQFALSLPWLLHYGFFFFVLSVVGALGNRFVQLFKDVQKAKTKEENLRKTFQIYVPPKDLERILKENEKGEVVLQLGGAMEFQSIFFSDVRDFTSFSEKLTPDQVVAFLNSYFTRMNEVIAQYNGVVDKLIGDSIMARFDQDGPLNALRAALEMRVKLAEYNMFRSKQNYVPIRIGIGIASGPVVIGNIGSQNRMDFTVIGDTVNLASRLEGVTKFFHVPIVIDQNTYSIINQQYPQFKSKFVFRELDLMKVKGKEQPVLIYELISEY